MRQAFAHDAVIVMEPGGDVRAPGAAITVALCGHWDHEPPCPLAPHATVAEADGDAVRLRVLFAAEPAAEAEVRERIESALAAGGDGFQGPDGAGTRWRLQEASAAPVGDEEAEHAARLTRA